MKKVLIVALLSVFIAGCASPITPQAKEDLSKPVNCATAEQDIKTLEAEKASVATQVASGATAVLPVSAVIAILGGNESAKIEVAVGEYNDRIDKKIAEIKQQCNIK